LVPSRFAGRSRKQLEQERDRNKQKKKEIFEMDGDYALHR
jgi:hypothetical protein